MERILPFSWFRSRWFALAIVFCVIIKNAILAEQPFVVRSFYPHDDTLFLSQAIAILSGEWLGPYNQLTLLRGPIYSLWISFVYLFGIPLIHANDLLYLGACLLFLRAIAPLNVSRPVLFCIFGFLYFAPHSYDYVSISHAFRMQIYPSLALLTVSAALGIALRLYYRDGHPVAWSLLLGLFFVTYWFTREEGIWMLSALAGFLLLSVLLQIKRVSLVSALQAVGYLAIVPVLVFHLVAGGLEYMNYRVYGKAVILDIKAPEFKRAYNGLLRIKTDKPLLKTPVTAETLAKLYELSPKMAELAPHLMKVAKGIPFGGEIPAAHFIFAFRDAVAAAGYYDEGAQETLTFYAELADELESLCDQGSVACGDLLLSMVPLWRHEFSEKLPKAILNQYIRIVTFPEFDVKPRDYYSSGDRFFIYNSARLLHSYPRVTQKAQWNLQFPDHIEDFKFEVARTIGNAHQYVRPVLFVASLLALAWILFSEIRSGLWHPLTAFALFLLAGLSALAVALAIIEVTSFHMLFRPRHGGYPLVSLLIVCVGLHLHIKRKVAKSAADPCVRP